MLDQSRYVPYGPEPIKMASRGATAALQTERLQWTLQHAYENMPACREKFSAAGVGPADFTRLEDLCEQPRVVRGDRQVSPPSHPAKSDGSGRVPAECSLSLPSRKQPNSLNYW